MFMVFVNKLILRDGKQLFNVTPENLLIIQCSVSAMLTIVLSFLMNFPLSISLQNFEVCLIENVAFIGVMLANSYSLRYLSIHMVTLLKCLSVVVTAVGDKIFLKHHFSSIIWASLILIVIGSSLGLITDIEFSMVGYFWMFLSIVFASIYVLLTKLLISHRKLHFMTAVFWNNLISTILLLFFSAVVNNYIFKKPYSSPLSLLTLDSKSKWLSPFFIIFSGILGLLLNLATFSLLGETSATSYVVVGASKKILQAILSFIIFNAKTTVINAFSICIGLSGSTLYAYAKWKENRTKHFEEEEIDDDETSLLDHRTSNDSVGETL